MARFFWGAVLVGLIMWTGCAWQTREEPPSPDTLSLLFQQANIPVGAVRVVNQLPTSQPLVFTNGLEAPRGTLQTPSTTSNLVGNPNGFYSVVKAYHVPNNDQDPIRLMGAALIKPGQTEVAISVESTALSMVAYWDWVDWVTLGLPSLEAIEPQVQQHPRYSELVRRIRDAVERGESPYEDDGIVDLSAEIAGDLVANLIASLPNTIEPLSQSPTDTPSVRFVGGDLEVINDTSITWVAGWMGYESEQILSTGREVVIPEADLSFRWLTGPATKTLNLSGSLDGRYLVCLVPSALGGWSKTNGAFPLQDLLVDLNGIATTRGWIEFALTLAGFVGPVALVAGLVDAALDESVLSATVAVAKAGVDAYLNDVESRIRQAEYERNLHRLRISISQDQIARIEREIADPNLRRSPGAQWKNLAQKYRSDIAILGRKLGKNYFTKSGEVDLRFSNQVGLYVLNQERALLQQQLNRELRAAQEIERRLGWLKGIKLLGKFLVVPTIVDTLGMTYDVVKYKDTYACYDVQVGTGGIRPTLGPNMQVTPPEISNGRKDETYVFNIKVLHLTQQSANFSLSWNFGDGTTGSRNVSASRSPHNESISHAYSNPGAYGLTIQLSAGTTRASQVVPVYIEMPEQSNDYNLNICNVWKAANSGGYGITRDNWDISVIPDGAVFDIAFDTYSIPDRIFVEYPVGTQVLDTGWRGSSRYDGDPKYPGGISGPGAGQFDNIFRKQPGQNTFRVTVVGPDPGTAWKYSIRCRTGVSPQSAGPTEVSPDPEAQRLFRNNPER